MHSYECSDTVFNYNSDMSGDVLIYNKNNDDPNFIVPAQDLLDFVANYVRTNKISKIEEKSTNEILGL